MYDYNTTRSHLILKEYGRNIQKLMEQFISIEDKNTRTQKAHAIVKLMEIINPHAESIQKRWDDLFILSDYKLNIDMPGPRPVKKHYTIAHDIPATSLGPIKYKYYGRHIESLLHKITLLSSAQEQTQMLTIVAKLMRRFSSIWNNDYISNEKIIQDIQKILPRHVTINYKDIAQLPDEHTNYQKNKSNRSAKSSKSYHIPTNGSS